MYYREARRFGPIICIPTSIWNNSRLVEITTFGDKYTSYIDNESGRIHDSEVYEKRRLDAISCRYA